MRAKIKARLVATSALSAVACFAISARPAVAADPTPPPATPGAQASNDQGRSVAELIVTGTHIPRPNLDQPTPIEVIPQQIIQDAGSPDLGNVIAQLPALSAQGTVRSNANSFSTVSGEDFADLRNLGPNRTLVLVDGKRHVAGDPNSEAVDLSSIPPALVDHVEVVTGGASAIYGSDALAGVVNIILKRRFEGLQVDAEGGAIEPGSVGSHYNFDFTAGKTFADGRANITVTGLYDHQETLGATDIRAQRNYGEIVNPNDEVVPGSANPAPIPNDGIPDFLLVPNVDSNDISTTGVIMDPLLAAGQNLGLVTTFDRAGHPIPQQLSVGFNSFAFGSFPGGCATCFRLEDFEDIIPRTDRAGGDIRFDWDVLPNVRFSLDAKYIHNEVVDFEEPSFTFFQDFLNSNNAFLTPQLSTLLAPTFAADQAAGLPGPFINRFLSDLGDRPNDIVRETIRVVAGFDGKFDAHVADVTWDVSYNYGTTRNRITSTGDRISGNFEAALQSVIDPATGKPACEINVPSVAAADPFFVAPAGVLNAAACVPYNPFGDQNSQAAINYITQPLHEFEDLIQQVADINLSFDTSRIFNLPGGPIGIAVGGEWRQESLSNIQDPLVVQGLTEVAKTPNAFGSFSVYEGYIEANAPILKHVFLADELSVDGAYRIANYSTVHEADAWKVSGVYGPFEGLKFRGTYSQAVRAPNLTEAFLPPSGTFFTIADPCSAENIGSNANFAANCAAQGIPAGFLANTNASPPGVVSGNKDLTPERSTSYTLGFVAQPRMIPKLSVTVDYYNIKIKDAISLITGQNIVNNCYSSSAGLDPTFCSLFTRDPVTHNINFITQTYVNSAALQTDGIEAQIYYAYDVGSLTQGIDRLKWLNGQLSVDLDVNWLHRLRLFPFQANPTQVTIQEGELGWPEWKGLATITYSQGPWRFDWQTNYLSAVDRYNKSPGNEDPIDQISPLFVGEQVYDNLVVHYLLPIPHHGTADLYLGVNDLMNSGPPLNTINGNPNGPDGSAVYELGREIFGGVHAKF